MAYEYLGTSVDLQSALRCYGLFNQDATEFDNALKRRIANDISTTEGIYTPNISSP